MVVHTLLLCGSCPFATVDFFFLDVLTCSYESEEKVSFKKEKAFEKSEKEGEDGTEK